MTQLHIIAEAGTNHNASLETARRLADAAATAGADSVKFQIIYPEGLYAVKLLVDGRFVENEVVATRRAGMLSDDDYRRLADHCRERRLPLSASVFDERGLALLDEFDPPYIKIASCDLNNSRLLKRAAERGRKLIVSTGMSKLGEVERAVDDILSTGNGDLVLMHCVSVYPCPTEEMNLGFLSVLKSTFGLPVGLSDHTENSLAAAAAVALGATWFEKHLTLDRTSKGFDHAYAMEPASLKQYILDLRCVARALTPRPGKVGPAEAKVRSRARRALYAARDIAAGETITEPDLIAVRPEGPLSPNDHASIVGKPARCAIRQYEPIAWNLID